MLVDFWMFEFGESLHQGLSREGLLLISWFYRICQHLGFGKIQVLLALFPYGQMLSLLPDSVLNLVWGAPHAPYPIHSQSPCPRRNQVPMGRDASVPKGKPFVERLELSHAWISRREAVDGLFLTPC